MKMKRNRIFFAMLIAWAAAGGAIPQRIWAVEAMNKVCPVMPDHKPNGKAFVEYQGKKYGVCCKSCVKKFNRNPEKYLARMAQQAGCQGDSCK